MTVFEYHAAGNSEAQQKEALAYLLAQSSTGKAATGVLSGLLVAQTTTASGSVTVAAGAGVAQAAVLDGASVVINDTQVTLDVLGANPLGGVPRNDIVVLDRATKSVRAIIGTPNATPTDPTVPASAVRLARLRHVTANAGTIPSSAIDDLRTFTRLFRPDGAPWAMAAGGGPVNTTIVSDALVGPFPQVFPAGRFTVPPNITMGTSDARCQLQATSITTSGFNLWVRNVGPTTSPSGQTVTWQAVQMTPTSANG